MKQTFTLFSDYFALRDNWLTRFDPRVKIVTVLAAVLSVVFSTRPWYPLFVFAVCIGSMISIRIPIRVIVLRFVPVAGILLVLVVLRSFLVGSTLLYTFSIMGHELSVTREGIMEGFLLGSRVAGAISVVMLSSFITPAPQVYAALLWFRMPKIWIEIASMVYRYVFVILDRARNTILAQRARHGYNGTLRSLNSMGTLSGAVFLRAFEQAERTHRAMTARGYKGTMPTGSLPALRAGHLLAMFGVCAVVLCCFFVFERMAG